MPSAEARHITRPRQSFSCLVCRRRKVRCGREQPACSNCVKVRERCEYEADVQAKAAVHSEPKPTAGPLHANARNTKTNTQSAQERCPRWTTHGADAALASHEEYMDDGSEIGDQPVHLASNGGSSPASSSSLHGGNSSVQSSGRNSTQTFLSSISEPLSVQPPSRAGDFQPDNNLYWKTPVTEGLQHFGQLSSPSILSKSTQHALQNIPQGGPHKRLRFSNNPDPVGGPIEVARSGPDSPIDGEGNAWAFTERNAFNNPKINTRTNGHLSVRYRGQTRYVQQAFWAFLNGHEELCERSLGEPSTVPENVPQPHIDSMGLANLLTTLPPKPLCDSLLESFSISVFPIHPMIHWATFQKDYNNFWQWCRNSDIAQPDNKLLGDPTFLCLLFSTLYCGASTAAPMLWSSAPFKETSKKDLLVQLGKTYSTSLELCQASDYPTMYTLVASLFTHSASRADASAMADLRFITSSLRDAQVMGLHRDGAAIGLSLIECEMRRRVWWHIIWLDAQASLLHGHSSCYGYSEAQHKVAMVTDVHEEHLSSISVGLHHHSLSPAPSMISITMLYSIGRFEVAQFRHFLNHTLDSTRHEESTLYDKIIKSARVLQEKLDKLIARLPTQGIAETGFVPSRYHNASPFTHQGLYRDHPSLPTIWSSWVRILLGMLKADVVISVQKPFLDRAHQEAEQQQKVWHSIVQSCIAYLRSFMQITQIPAFAPYMWYSFNHHAPLQCVFLILTYLQHNRHSEHAHLARYYVDEVIDVFTSNERLAKPGTSNQDLEGEEEASQIKPKPYAWKMLVELRHRLDLPPHVDPPLFRPTVPIRCQPVSPAVALRTISLSIGENPSEDVARDAIRGPGNARAPRISTTEPQLASTHSLAVNDQYGDQPSHTNIEQLLDLSHLDTWSSNLVPKATEDFPPIYDDFADLDNTIHMQDSLGPASLALP